MDPKNIAYSRGIDSKEASALAIELAKKQNATSAVVVAIDIRKSTTLMQQVEHFQLYSDAMTNLLRLIRFRVQQTGGWFDKFTGDGAMCFWPYDGQLNNQVLLEVMDFCANLHVAFAQHFVQRFLTSTGCFPSGFGLAVGIDAGRCYLTDMHTSSAMELDGTMVSTDPVLSSVTALGRPVVGAVRVLRYARAYQTVFNSYPGEFLWRLSRAGKIDEQASIEPISFFNPDITGSQVGFILVDDRIDAAVRAYTPYPLEATSRPERVHPSLAVTHEEDSSVERQHPAG